MSIASKQRITATIIIAFAMLISLSIVVHGSSPNDIVFPIEELSGCETKAECKDYCDNPTNYEACIAFAQEHNLMEEGEAQRAKKFAQIAAEGGPGGCTSHRECEAYCENLQNIQECLAFARQHDMLEGEELEEAQKVAKALEAGAELPGGCTNKRECEAYCSDMRHVEECVAFAEKAGFMNAEELEEMRRIMPLMQSGEMPGGCTSQQECEAYCSDPDNFQECIAFAEKAGFMTSEEAEIARKTGGAGPGGCRGEQECEAYCNNPENMRVCFEFAKEHGLLSDEDVHRMEEGLSKMREGLEQAQPEVIDCLKDRLGDNIIERIRSDNFLPGPHIGEEMRYCFEEVGGEFMRREVEQNLSQIPPEAESCIVDEYGENYIDRMINQEIDPNALEALVQSCVEEKMKHQMEEDFSHFPPEVQRCIGNQLGADYQDRLFSGELDREAIEPVIRSCIKDHQKELGDEYPTHDGDAMMGEIPPEAEKCLVRLYGDDIMERMRNGEFVPPADMEEKLRRCMSEYFM